MERRKEKSAGRGKQCERRSPASPSQTGICAAERCNIITSDAYVDAGEGKHGRQGTACEMTNAKRGCPNVMSCTCTKEEIYYGIHE